MKTLVYTAIIISAVAYLCTFTVSEREYVILTRFGKPVKTIDTPGLQKKLPGFVESVNRIDKRTHIFTTQPIQLLLGDKNPIVMTCYVCWRVNAPLLFFQSLLNTDIATQKLSDMVNSQMGNALGTLSLEHIINTGHEKTRLADLEAEIRASTDARARESYGIAVLQVGVRRLAYPSVVADAVYNRMRSEREKEAEKYRAQGKEAAAGIRAAADREAREIMARALKEAEIIRGEGDRQAMKIYTDAYMKDETFYAFTRSMDLYKKILGEKSTLVLSTDSDLFRYLNPSREPDRGQQ